jgi:hypothetical protein
MVLEEPGAQPVFEARAHHLFKFRSMAATEPAGELRSDPRPDPFKQRCFAGIGGERDDPVGIGPVGHRLAGLDLLWPPMAEHPEDHDGEAVGGDPPFLGDAPPALLLYALFQEPVDGDGVDLQFLGEFFEEGLGRDRM